MKNVICYYADASTIDPIELMYNRLKKSGFNFIENQDFLILKVSNITEENENMWTKIKLSCRLAGKFQGILFFDITNVNSESVLNYNLKKISEFQSATIVFYSIQHNDIFVAKILQCFPTTEIISTNTSTFYCA